MSAEPPIDHAELCARVRFRYDEPEEPSEDERRVRDRYARDRIARLHASALRVTPTLTPGLHAKLLEVSDRLLVRQPPALYVEEHPAVNAFAVHSGSRCFVTVTSGLANLLTVDEIGAVLGHELAHIGMRHSSRDANHPDAVSFLLEHRRAAEVSCDRLAVIAAGGARKAVSAMVKIVSGLSGAHIAMDVDAFLRQLEERPDDTDAEWEAGESHPVVPFRVWAMCRFADTDLCRSLLGQPGGEPFEKVEDEVCGRFSAIGEGFVSRQAIDHLHEALVWLGALAVRRDEAVSQDEEQVLSALVGSVWAGDAIEYHRTHGRRAVESRAKESLAALLHSGERIRRRFRDHLDRFLSESGNDAARAEVTALVDEAWKR